MYKLYIVLFYFFNSVTCQHDHGHSKNMYDKREYLFTYTNLLTGYQTVIFNSQKFKYNILICETNITLNSFFFKLIR